MINRSRNPSTSTDLNCPLIRSATTRLKPRAITGLREPDYRSKRHFSGHKYLTTVVIEFFSRCVTLMYMYYMGLQIEKL